MNKLVEALLNKEKSVRETIDEFATRKIEEGPLSDLADAAETGVNSAGSAPEAGESETNKTEEFTFVDDNEFPVKMLFVRRLHTGDEKPFKRIKCASCAEALKVFFQFATAYKNDTVEIWTSTANDAKNFYRFVLKNREQIEQLWKNCIRTKKLMTWPAAYRDVQQRARQSGSNLVGTLDPFNVLGN